MTRTFHSAPGRENSRSFQEYATVKATLAQRTDKALLLAREDLVQPVWIPRQALDVRGHIAAANAVLKTEIEIGVELRLALEKGLV